MSLTDFSTQSPSVVILDDERDPDVSWQNHLERAGANGGGVDTVAPVGTPVFAWADGIVERIPNNGSAGNVARVHLSNDPGWKHDFKHLSRYADLVDGVVRKGQVIGYSGTSGGVAPHLHQNLVDPSGVRQNPWHYTSDRAQSQEDDMTPTQAAQLEMIFNILVKDGADVADSQGKTTRVEGIRGVLNKTLTTVTNVEAILVDKIEQNGIRAGIKAIRDKLGI